MDKQDQIDLLLGRLTRLETRTHQLRVLLQEHGRNMRDWAFGDKTLYAIAAAKDAAEVATELRELLPLLHDTQAEYKKVAN